MTTEISRSAAPNLDEWMASLSPEMKKAVHDDEAEEQESQQAIDREKGFAQAVLNFYGGLPDNAIVLWDIDGTMGRDRTPWAPRPILEPLMAFLKEAYPKIRNGVLSDRPQASIGAVLKVIPNSATFFDKKYIFSNKERTQNSVINEIRGEQKHKLSKVLESNPGPLSLDELVRLSFSEQGKFIQLLDLQGKGESAFLIDDMRLIKEALPSRVLAVSLYSPLISGKPPREEASEEALVWGLFKGDLGLMVRAYMGRLQSSGVSTENLHRFVDDFIAILRANREMVNWKALIAEKTAQSISDLTGGETELGFDLVEEANELGKARGQSVDLKTDQDGRCTLLYTGLKGETAPKAMERRGSAREAPKSIVLDSIGLEGLKRAYESLPKENRTGKGNVYSWEEIVQYISIAEIQAALNTLHLPRICGIQKDRLVFMDGGPVREGTRGRGYQWNEDRATQVFSSRVERKLATVKALRLRGEPSQEVWLSRSIGETEPPSGEAFWAYEQAIVNGQYNCQSDPITMPWPNIGALYMVEVLLPAPVMKTKKPKR